MQVLVQHALNEVAVIYFVDFWNKLPIMAPSPEVVWCVGFIMEQGASRWFRWCRILQNNASSAASKISVISVKSGEQKP